MKGVLSYIFGSPLRAFLANIHLFVFCVINAQTYELVGQTLSYNDIQ